MYGICIYIELNVPENKPKGNFQSSKYQDTVLPSNQYGDLHVHWCGLHCVALRVECGVISMTLVGIHLNSRLTEASHLVAQSHVIKLSGKLNTLLKLCNLFSFFIMFIVLLVNFFDCD